MDIIFIKNHPVGIAVGHIVKKATPQQITEFVDGGYAKENSQVVEETKELKKPKDFKIK